jgi:hypothetical protein
MFALGQEKTKSSVFLFINPVFTSVLVTHEMLRWTIADFNSGTTLLGPLHHGQWVACVLQAVLATTEAAGVLGWPPTDLP